MGLFDYIRCEMPLPGDPDPDMAFQTKDFDPMMDMYTITSAGRLVLESHGMDFGDVNYHGMINFYRFDEDENWWEYDAKFTDGKCVEIKAASPDKQEQLAANIAARV